MTELFLFVLQVSENFAPCDAVHARYTNKTGVIGTNKFKSSISTVRWNKAKTSHMTSTSNQSAFFID